MKFIVTPDFNKKITSLADDGRRAISEVTKFITNTDRDKLSKGTPGIEVRPLGSEILTIKHDKYRVYASFGSNDDGEYLLLLDLSLEASQLTPGTNFFAVKNPTTNPMIDPRRNTMIDPRRNMMIDPRRNMMIDPHRNMMIDPRRNMMIDPRRNMMIDPRRNMMIDPRRNMMIDPRRNMMIDPRRNRYYGGPYLYNTNLEQEGFIVRANETVSLIFDASASFTNFCVATGKGGSNIFDMSGNWAGFIVPANSDVLLRFDTQNEWRGIIV